MSWAIVNLGDVATFLNGYPFKPTEWATEGLEIIRIQNLTKGSSETNYFKGEAPAKYKIVKGDILISWSATLDIFVWDGNDAWLNQHIFKVVFDKIQINKQFFIYLIKHILNDMRKAVHGATMKHITKAKFDNLKVPLPPLPIQKRIAEILDAADALKRKDQALLKKYDELAQAIFIDMFGDPVKNERGWEVKRLKEISTNIHSGNTPKGGSNVYVKNGITFFRSQNVWKNNLVYDDIAFIDNKTHLSMMKSSLKHKDILMTKTGRINTENSSLGRAALFLGDDDSANINGHVYLIRLQKNQVHEFVVHILTTKEYRGLIRDVCVGGIDKRQLNKDHIEDFPIIYPPLATQQKFAKLLAIIQKQKKNTDASSKKSEAIFEYLIQKAFKGELVK